MAVIDEAVEYRLLIPLLSIFLAACVPQEPLPTGSPATQIESKPGVKPVLDEQAVWNEYNCGSKKLPFIIIERDDIAPLAVRPGQEFRYRFVYAACTSGNQKTIKGTLDRKIYYRGRLIFQDIKWDFVVMPGKWDVTALVRVPPKAVPGTYSFELTLKSPVTTIMRSSVFIVKR